MLTLEGDSIIVGRGCYTFGGDSQIEGRGCSLWKETLKLWEEDAILLETLKLREEDAHFGRRL